jgi:HAD superfamily hydrolase (TIGR01509 family)
MIGEAAPRVLLLDVMDTLVRDPFYEVVPAFFGMSLDELIAQKDPDAWPRFERGEIDHAEMMATFFADRRRFDHAAFAASVQGAYAFLPGVEVMLAELAARGVAMYALSNYPTWSEWIEEKLGLGRFLDWRFVSWRTGTRKPAAEAYRRPLRELGVAAAECLFVDDRASNCDAAREEGMRAHRFVDATELRRELRALGILG